MSPSTKLHVTSVAKYGAVGDPEGTFLVSLSLRAVTA